VTGRCAQAAAVAFLLINVDDLPDHNRHLPLEITGKV
jgi:hypothetical protein